MALINTLNEIGNAIREKTGGTELIPLKEMASAIKNIVSGAYNDGYADGIASVPNPFEYAKILNSLYAGSTFPKNYEMTINIPLVTSMTACFSNTRGLTKLTVKGNIAENVINMSNAFRVPTLEILDLNEFNTIIGADGNNIFNGAKVLREIKGTLDFTNVTKCENVFNVCYELVEVRFKANSIKLSIIFSHSSKLSAESVQSIINGLATVETAQTLTLHSSIVLTDEQKAQISSKNWTLVQ